MKVQYTMTIDFESDQKARQFISELIVLEMKGKGVSDIKLVENE